MTATRKETNDESLARQVREARPAWWAYAAIFLSSLALSLAALLISVKYSDNNERKWCDIVTTLDSAYHQAPPKTPTGQKLASDMHRLKIRLGCK